MNTICLALICKNEAGFIREALRSVKPYITHWCVVDTGSTDGTQDIVREEMQGIPGTLIERSWMGWSETRNFCIDQAFDSGCDWVLILDADETLSGTIPELKDDEVGWVTVKFGGITYNRPNLINKNQTWAYTGVTHEYLSAPENPNRVLLPLTVTTNPARATKTPERCAEDLVILEEALVTEPENTRYWFYAANSAKDSGQREKAIELYKKRALMGGWAEEVYISLLRIAQLSEGIKSFSIVCDAYKAAHIYRPQRAGETLRNFARYCQNWADNTYLPVNEQLFIDPTCYKQPPHDIKVAVIIPSAGNRSEWLEQAKASVQLQTVTCELIVTLGDTPVTDRVNDAIARSTADAFVFLCDDDLLEPTFVEKTVARLKAGYDIVHTKYTHFGQEDCITGSSNHIAITSLCRRETWKKAGGYKNIACYDYDFWLSCLETGAKPSFIDEPLWLYRIHEGQENKTLDMKKATEAVIERHKEICGVAI